MQYVRSSSSANRNLRPMSQTFHTRPWGGSVQNFTVPPGVSKIKLTAVPPGGCLASSAISQNMNSAGNNVFFARLNGVDPAFIGIAVPSTSLFCAKYFGKFINGSVINSAAEGINGRGDMGNTSRMNGSYFNAADTVPWGIVITQQAASGAQMLSATTDGFNFVHTPISTTTAPVILSCAFGANGQAMVLIGTNQDNCYYTSDYGVTWTLLLNAKITGSAVTRLRYLNGTWLAMSNENTFRYTTAPIVKGAIVTWSTSSALAGGLFAYDIGWTGSYYIVACSNGTNVNKGTTLNGAWALQAHGGDLAFNAIETAATGEVILFNNLLAITSGTSARATSGAATSWVSVATGLPVSGIIRFDALKHMPFSGGSMWLVGVSTTTSVYSRASALTGAWSSAVTIAAAITGNAFTNATAINNIQYLGSNYCHLGGQNGLGQYVSAGVITADLATSAQLTTEFGYWSNVTHAPPLTVAKNGTTILRLQGGGHAGAGAIATASAGPGGNSKALIAGSTAIKPGKGPSGRGGVSNATIASILPPSGNGGVGGTVANTFGGGPTWSIHDSRYAPQPGTIVPGGDGSYGTNAALSGGGASLFASAGDALLVTPTFADPLTVFTASGRIGEFGAGAHSAQYLTGAGSCSAGGAEGCYQYAIDVTPGDLLSLTMPGLAYVMANGATGTHGGPGGESHAIIEWEV